MTYGEFVVEVGVGRLEVGQQRLHGDSHLYSHTYNQTGITNQENKCYRPMQLQYLFLCIMF